MQTVTVLKSSHVTVRTVTFVDAPQVHINFQDITEGHVKGITVLAPWSSPNTDGIHISGTTDFVVRNCYVATGPSSSPESVSVSHDLNSWIELFAQRCQTFAPWIGTPRKPLPLMR